MLSPDHRVGSLKTRTVSPKNKDDKAVWDYFLHGVVPKNKDLFNSINKYEDTISNYILQAFLLAELDQAKISAYLGVSKKSLNYFTHYFFDIDMFCDKLSKMSYYFNLANSTTPPPTIVLAWLKLAVYTQKEYFETIFLNPSDIEIDMLLRRVLIDTFTASVGIDGDTRGTQTQIQFINALIKAADILKKYKSDGIKDPLKSLRFLIESNKRDVKVEVNTQDIVT